MKDMLDKHMLSVYDAGFISPDKQFLTVGGNGINQAAQYLGLTISDNPDYMKFIQRIFGTISEADREDRDPANGIKINFELVPAENLGAKNAKWDKKDGYETAGADIYNSYIYLPEDEKMSIQERFRLHGVNYTGYCDGGSALHVNLKEHLTYDQYKWLMKYAIKCGTTYYTYNVPFTECKSCKSIFKRPLSKCPKCGSEDLDYATRVIGYVGKISNWSPERQAEFKRRYFAEGLKQEENE